MLRVTFEIVPHGEEDKCREIGKMIVALQSVDNMNIGTYISQLVADAPVATEVVKINDPYDLVRRCLEEHLKCG